MTEFEGKAFGMNCYLVTALLVLASVLAASPGSRASEESRREVNVTRGIEIVAHRGESHLAPENTLAAVRRAWQLGDQAVEVDVHLSKDGRIVVIHDGSTGRVAGRDMVVSESDSADLRSLDVGVWKNPRHAGERTPFLEEVLKTVPPGRHLFIEVKSGAEAVPLVRRAIEKSGKASQVTVIGFDLATMALFKKAAPRIAVYWLVSSKARFDHSIANMAVEHGLDGLNVSSGGVDKAFVDAVRAKNLKLYVWTVDEINEARRVVDLGVDGITTNRAAWMMEQLGLGDRASW